MLIISVNAGLSGNVYSVPEGLQHGSAGTDNASMFVHQGSLGANNNSSMHAHQGSTVVTGSSTESSRVDAAKSLMASKQNAATAAFRGDVRGGQRQLNGVAGRVETEESTNKQVCNNLHLIRKVILDLGTDTIVYILEKLVVLW